ncbi:hypothetical protein HYFRA_00005121 [Hymenoscyphus fraxineus]|uniref:Uncharacterized protein n=1 Tax=Hymenoscyphus fraxineus TaxID=746836 RepID=A0A9N9Q0E9_9HELO|nr:hypothetical protein HYFRA_00005121 [Hymenoscyphus fraxineus]
MASYDRYDVDPSLKSQIHSKRIPMIPDTREDHSMALGLEEFTDPAVKTARSGCLIFRNEGDDEQQIEKLSMCNIVVLISLKWQRSEVAEGAIIASRYMESTILHKGSSVWKLT